MTPIITRSRKPDITFFRSGRIDICARIARILNLSSGDVINIATSGKEFLLYVSTRGSGKTGNHTGTVLPTKSNSRNFRTYAKSLARAILQLIGNPEKAALPIGTPTTLPDGTTAIPIIIKNNLAS